MLRRMYIGALLDTDSIAYDPAASSGLRWMELAPGVLFTQGVSHNSMVVEMSDHLIVFDAPISDAFSQAVLAELKKRYPTKPVRTLVMTHHHMDHAYGARTYMAQGVTLVTNTGNAAVFREMAQAPHSRSGDLPSTAKLEPRITEVADRLTLTDGKRNVTVYSFPNPHSAVALFGYVEDAKLGFVTDVWSPARETIGAQLTSGQASLAAAVQKAGIQPERFAGGHGGVASYADIAAKAK
jgi:glyoxylase-like metal-dependent hydrolase (beta-lactamase superfamily II)